MSPLILLPTIDPLTILLTLALVTTFLLLTERGKNAFGTLYLHLTGTSPTHLARPISYFGKDDPWPVFDSFSLWARAVKAVRGTPASVLRGREGLRELSGSGWRQICNFAVDTTSNVWISDVKLERWRMMADPQADAALAALRRVNPVALSKDPLTDICTLDVDAHTAASLPPDHPRISISSASPTSPSCRPFLDQISDRPPRGAGAISEAWFQLRDERRKASGLSVSTPLSAEELAEELREEARVIRAGQQVFYKYLEPMQITLLHFSLTGGFSSPKIMSVLRQTGYLVPSRDPYAEIVKPKATDNPPTSTPQSIPSAYALPLSQVSSPAHQRSAARTLTRLMETSQFVADVMQDVDGLLPPPLHSSAWVRSLFPQHAHADAGKEDGSHSMAGGLAEEERAFLERVGGGRGWQAAVRVRLLHASVRARIWASIDGSHLPPGTEPSKSDDGDEARCPFDTTTQAQETSKGAGKGKYDVALSGQPINQEDTLATLAGFSSAPLWCLSRLGLPLTPQEREDFTALWRHVGFYMGCDVDLLRVHFADARAALGLLFSVVGHVYPESVTGRVGEGEDDQDGKTTGQLQHRSPHQQQGTIAALALLQAVADQPPLRIPLEVHHALARHFLGPCLATYLRLPRTRPRTQLAADLLLLSAHVPVHFTSACVLYPRALRERWMRERVRLARGDVRRVVRGMLGGLATYTGQGGLVREGKGGVGRDEWARVVIMVEMTGFMAALGAAAWAGFRYGLLPLFSA
ncbi:hypothetical protein OC844_004925 [Tilletia horrida]|nr:hypothetical protein OC844_004925 [Tilletia horrida]